jgi:hypothetical protein
MNGAYNETYVLNCLLGIAACVARVVEEGEPLDAEKLEYLRVHLNSVRHEQRKLSVYYDRDLGSSVTTVRVEPKEENHA